MRILLVNPPFPFEETPTAPLGLTSLAAYLLREGVDVAIEDCIVQPHTRARVREVLDRVRPDLVGVTAVTMNVKAALRVLEDYRDERPDLATVMGGPHVTFDAENILAQNPFVDLVVRGEGEETLTELARALDARSPLEPVAGVSFRSGGRVVHNPDRPFIRDLDGLPLPARHLVPVSRYRALGFPITMVTSRGCPYQCIFCVGRRMVGSRVRTFGVDRVLDEFETLVRMDFSQICIVDDLFTANRKRCIEICDGIVERGIVFPWAAFARVDTVTEDFLGRMKAAGCTSLCFGMESGNQAILDRIKKRTTVEAGRRAAEMCHRAGVEPMMSFILGLPGETAETIEQTMAFAESLGKSYGFHILAPFPGTEVRDRCAEYGMKILTDDWDLYDANRSVADTGSVEPARVDRAVEAFNATILGYLERLDRRKDAGEPLTPWEEAVWKGRFTQAFNRGMILGGLLDAYPGLGNGAGPERVVDDFVAYLAGRVDHPRERIRDQVERLLSLGCLEARTSESGTRLAWV